MKTLYVNNMDLAREKRFTFLTEDIISGGSTFRVQSVLGFTSLTTSSGQIICVGELGGEKTELLRTSNSTAPSLFYKEVTLRDSLQFDHPQDTKVTIVDWNRADVQWAATGSGSKSTLQAYPQQLQPDQVETIIQDTTKTSGFYFIRFNESIGDTNSDWSDPIPFAGYDDNMVFSIKQRALESAGETIDDKLITHDFLNSKLWEARREFHKAPGKRPFRRKYNTVIGTALTGSYRIDLPADVEKPYAAENIYGVRIGTNPNMRFIDKKLWDFQYIGKPHTTLLTAYTPGARDLYVSNARDFADQGAVSIEGTTVSYSEKSNAGGTLRISDDGSWACSAGSDTWQNVSYGLPNEFTVWADPLGSAYIYFNRPIETSYIGMNIYADYYMTLPGYNSDADVLDEPDYDMYTPYLASKVKQRKARGDFDLAKDPDFNVWTMNKKNALDTENLEVELRISPDIGHLQLPE